MDEDLRERLKRIEAKVDAVKRETGDLPLAAWIILIVLFARGC